MLKAQAEMNKVQSKLAVESFVQNAPSEVVSDHRHRLGSMVSAVASSSGSTRGSGPIIYREYDAVGSARSRCQQSIAHEYQTLLKEHP